MTHSSLVNETCMRGRKQDREGDRIDKFVILYPYLNERFINITSYCTHLSTKSDHNVYTLE